MSASDTPRTDATVKQYDGSWFALGGPAGDLLVLCRELERELAAMTKERDKAKRQRQTFEDQLNDHLQKLVGMQRILDAATKERDEWKAKAEANERDAERLRFLVAEAYLCSDFGVDTETHTVRWECSKHRERVCGLYDALDIEIDRAKKRKILV